MGRSGFGGGGFGGGGFGGGGFGGGGFGSGGRDAGGFGFGYSRSRPFESEQTGFIGRSGQDMQSLFRGVQNSQNQFLDTYFQRRGQERSRERRRWERDRGEVEEAPPIRVRYQVAFDSLPAIAAEASSDVGPRLERMLTERDYAGTQVVVEGRTAILRGTVASAHVRRLVERMVSMEPGVSAVRNELTIAQSAELPLPPQ
jgi:hypothetical protein